MAATRQLILLLLMGTIQVLKSQGDFDFGGNSLDLGDLGDFGDFDNNFGDIDTSDVLKNLDDTMNDMKETMNNFGDDMEDAFNNFDFSDFANDQKERFDELLNKAGSFTQDQIDAINDAFNSGDIDNLNLTEDQRSALKGALEEWEDSDSSSVKAAVTAMMSGLVLGNILFT